MATGKKHQAAATQTIIVGSAVLALGSVALGPAMVIPSLLSAAGLAVGKWIDPDLDMIQITLTERKKLDAAPIAGRLWLSFWASYGALFTHRGISHYPILGTLTRLLYIMWRLKAGLLFALVFGIIDHTFFVVLGYVLLCVLPGWILQDVVHLHLDSWRVIRKI